MARPLEARARGQVSLAWLIVQACALVLMFSLHRIDFVSRLWFAYWTAISGGLLIAWRLDHARGACARMRSAGMNLHQVAIVGCGAHCDAIMRRIESAPHGTGFRATAVYNTRPEQSPVTITRVPVFDSVDAFAELRPHERRARGVAGVAALAKSARSCALVNEFRDDLVNIRFMPGRAQPRALRRQRRDRPARRAGDQSGRVAVVGELRMLQEGNLRPPVRGRLRSSRLAPF